MSDIIDFHTPAWKRGGNIDPPAMTREEYMRKYYYDDKQKAKVRQKAIRFDET